MSFTEQARPFQLFGFDFMLDSGAQVHLLEVNGSPAARELLLPSVAAEIVRVLQVVQPVTCVPSEHLTQKFRNLAVFQVQGLQEGHYALSTERPKSTRNGSDTCRTV
jgi:hypothetical protein